MSNTKKPLNTFHSLTFLLGVTLTSSALADLRLASDWHIDWNNSKNSESSKLLPSAMTEAQRLAATPADPEVTRIGPELGFQLYFEDRKYYIQPMLFMAKDKPDEVCNPLSSKSGLRYRCEEGQTYKHSCHLMFFNTSFEPVGLHRIRTDEPFPVWCNAVIAVGVHDKKRNELLVTFQYFPTDRKVASKISEVGSGWIRMTSLFRLKEDNGRILVEQDDLCLGNPNQIETIPEARKLLKQCKGPK